jgi:hypothetical protein
MVSQASRSYDESDSTNPEKESAFEARQRESLVRPTPEMQRILARRAAQEIRRQSLSWKDQLAEYNQRSVFFFIPGMYVNGFQMVGSMIGLSPVLWIRIQHFS